MFSLPAWLIPSFLRPTMDFEVRGIDLLLKRDVKNSTDEFLYYFLSEGAHAKEDPNKEVLERFIVDKIDLDQCIRPPQHEYLTIDTLDTWNNNNKKQFILERVLAPEPNPTPNAANIPNAANLDLDIHIDPDRNLPFFSKIYDKIKEIADCVVATLTAMTSNSDLASDQLSSMEEGTLPSFPPPSLPLPSVASECLSMTDSVTVSVSESAESVSDAVSDSLDKTKTAAYDRFLGEYFTTPGLWHGEGEMLESFSPKRLTLFELVCIAYVVHKLYPDYTKLGTNCYFYAGLVSAVAKRFGGVRPGTTTHLAQHGRWNGVKITRVKQHHVDRVLAEFKHLKSTQIGVVSLSSSKLLSLTNTFYIGQPSFLSEFKVYSYGRHRT